MQDKTVFITGATSGIGFEAAKVLAQKGARVVFTSRSESKGQKTLEALRQWAGHERIHMIIADLSVLSSVREAAGQFLDQFERLDVLINNAGLWANRRTETPDGLEMNLAVNHLAPFLLTNLLMDRLQEGVGGRIIMVSSEAHRSAHFNFKDPELKQRYIGFVAYAQSKLANILFTRKLAEMLDPDQVTANCLHPGVVATNLFDKVTPWLKKLFGVLMLSPEKGAETTIYLATAPQAASYSGAYFVKKRPKEPSKAAQNDQTAQRIWDLSLEYVADYLPASSPASH